VLGRALDAEELGPRSEGQDQIVVRERCHVRKPNPARREVDGRHLRLVHQDVALAVEQVPQRVATAVGSSRSVAIWYRNGWNVW
jgi:hypothetical protein